MRLIFACLLLATAGSLAVFSQQTTLTQSGALSYDLWRIRSQTISEELLKDSSDFTPSERALLLAKLAQRWWRDDPEKARSWMLKPVELVEAVPNKENPSERNQRLTTTRLLWKIVAPLDQKLGARLLVMLKEDAERTATFDRGANTDQLIEAAMFIVDKEPQRAAELGVLALRVGRPSQISELLARLRRKDAKLADSLFAQALDSVRETLDRDLLMSLTFVAFPDSMGAVGLPVPPDKLRTDLLRLDVVFLQANPVNAENRNSICASIGSFIVPVQAQFDQLLPQQGAVVAQSINQCNSADPAIRERFDQPRRDEPDNSIDALLKAAAEAKDVKVSMLYHYRAAVLAKEKNDLDLALKILDSMSSEERVHTDGSWESFRWEWAALSALSHFKRGDLYGISQNTGSRSGNTDYLQCGRLVY